MPFCQQFVAPILHDLWSHSYEYPQERRKELQSREAANAELHRYRRSRRLIGRAMTNQPKETLSGEVRKLPMMPIRDMVIFPHMMTPFVVGRESSVRALEEALSGDRKIFLATQHDASVDEPNADDIYQTGTIGNIVQSVKMPDGNIKVLVEGVERARATEINDVDGFFVATVRTGKTQLEHDAAGRAADAARPLAV